VKYALITSAKNEERFVRETLDSVCAQTYLPEGWVIVDDGSTDRTADIVAQYAQRYPWIDLVRLPRRTERHFAAKAHAVKLAFKRTEALNVDVVGNLDADISFSSEYMAFLIDQFEANPKLGVAGTPFTQDGAYDSARDSFAGENYVAGPCQMFRYECFAEIGGYVASRNGGVDWIAVQSARMKGWTVRSFPQKRYHHCRIMGTAETSKAGAFFDYGVQAYILGTSLIWHIFRVTYRMMEKPYVICGLALLAGYIYAAMKRLDRPVSTELIRFHRDEQMARLRNIFLTLGSFRKVDPFQIKQRPRVRDPRASDCHDPIHMHWLN